MLGTDSATDLDKWDEIVEKAEDDPDPVRRFFMVAAVRDLRTFMAVVARIIPQDIPHSPRKRCKTTEQALAELKAAGIPEDVLDFLRPVDPAEVVGRRNPYEDPDDENMPEVTPGNEAAE
jgi:hypothetical protein